MAHWVFLLRKTNLEYIGKFILDRSFSGVHPFFKLAGSLVILAFLHGCTVIKNADYQLILNAKVDRLSEPSENINDVYGMVYLELK